MPATSVFGGLKNTDTEITLVKAGLGAFVYTREGELLATCQDLGRPPAWPLALVGVLAAEMCSLWQLSRLLALGCVPVSCQGTRTLQCFALGSWGARGWWLRGGLLWRDGEMTRRIKPWLPWHKGTYILHFTHFHIYSLYPFPWICAVSLLLWLWIDLHYAFSHPPRT